MNVFLMYRDRDFNLQGELPWNEQSLTRDLDLNTLFDAMAQGDDFLFEVAKRAVLSGLDNDMETILYRQDILKDCLKNASIVRDMYDIAVESIKNEKKNYWGLFSNYPRAVLDRAVEVMNMFMDMLKKIKNIADEHADRFESEGFTAFFAMIKGELDDEYFELVQSHLNELKFRDGVLISAELGEGNKGTNYILRKQQNKKKQGWIKQFFSKKVPAYILCIPDRDESGFRALGELVDRV